MTKIHQEVKFAAPPAKVYRTLLGEGEHAKFTGAPAAISQEAGGAWSAYGGKISGRNVELLEGVRIVQTWRAGNWPDGVHSLVRFELTKDGTGTRLTLDHDALPEDQAQHLESGWTKMYWDPLRKYLET
jgi:uncharacterized protein YndB with AHSA1/START domain